MSEKGQSLTEMVVIAPLLLLMFIGMIEVGWAILGYMKLLQASREAARFATRSDVAKLWVSDQERGYSLIFDHFRQAGGATKATIIVHRYEIFTGAPCTTIPCDADCHVADMSDDHSDYQVRQDGPITRTARIDDMAQAIRLIEDNQRLNCEKQLRYYQGCLGWADQTQDSCKLLTQANVYTDHDADNVLVEAFYDQDQLTGFFWFANPVPLWVYTTTRIP